MRKSIVKGSVLVILLLVTLVVAGCSGFSGDNRGKCSEGDSCRFYTGSRGVMMYLDNPQSTFYYRSSDLANLDGNTMDFNVRLKNDGASDSYGAVFLSGFSGDMFKICEVSSTSKNCVNINKNHGSCFFDVMSLDNEVGNWNFLFGCLGSSYSQFGGTTRLNIGAQSIETLAKSFGWNIPLSSLQIAWNDEGILNFGIGTDFGVMNYGRSLMMVISSLNFEAIGGSTFTLKGDNAVSPGGDIDFKTFQVQMIAPWPAGQDYFRIPYQLKSCYGYTTFVSPMICIDPDPFSTEKKVCTSSTYTWGGSQGAPVAVTRLQQTNTGKEVVLDITIKNIGPGTVWDAGYMESCSPYMPGSVKANMLNTVYIGYAYIGTKALDCTNYYRIRLDPTTKDARFICRYDMSDADNVGSAYAIPLRMELWYGYEETISQQLTIRKLN
ncbi:MAG: hypothetical protein WC758_04020 [Candidatus Woesearchaeota archaeon]|jgi:hypothetical protein